MNFKALDWRGWMARRFGRPSRPWGWLNADGALRSVLISDDPQAARSLVAQECARGWNPDGGLAGWRRHDAGGTWKLELPLSQIGLWLGQQQGDPGRRVVLMALASELVERGAQLNAWDARLGEASAWPLLAHACGVWELAPMDPVGLKAILALGADPNATGVDGIPPLWVCACAEDPLAGELAALTLLEAGANPGVPLPFALQAQSLASRRIHAIGERSLVRFARARMPRLSAALRAASESNELEEAVVAPSFAPKAAPRRL